MAAASVDSIVTSVRRRMNLTSMTTISDADLQAYVLEAAASLYEMLVSRWSDYYTQRSTFSLAANKEFYELPKDFRAVTAVYLIFAQQLPAARVPLQLFNMNQLSTYPASSLPQPQWPMMYRLMGDKIWFTPVSTQSYKNAIELWYVPQWSAPANNDSPIADMLPAGWEQWVTLEVCTLVSARLRLMEFYQMFSAERQKAETRIIAAASIRDEDPEQMTDIYQSTQGYMYLGTPGTSY